VNLTVNERADPDRIEEALCAVSGMRFAVRERVTNVGREYRCEPADLPGTSSFTLVVALAWRSVSARVEFGTFARPLVGAMLARLQSAPGSFWAAANAIADAGTRVLVSPDPRQEKSPAIGESGDVDLCITLDSGFLVSDVDVAHSPDRGRIAAEYGTKLLALVLQLLPTGEEPDRSATCSLEEGARSEERSWRIERSPANRAACIAVHGSRCIICGLDMGSVYGELGEQYIHVHHLNPLAFLDGPRPVDPRTDLVPVCPNCHSMLHRVTPPLTPGQLREMMVAERLRTGAAGGIDE